jgi:hypothetical protein
MPSANPSKEDKLGQENRQMSLMKKIVGLQALVVVEKQSEPLFQQARLV